MSLPQEWFHQMRKNMEGEGNMLNEKEKNRAYEIGSKLGDAFGQMAVRNIMLQRENEALDRISKEFEELRAEAKQMIASMEAEIQATIGRKL